MINPEDANHVKRLKLIIQATKALYATPILTGYLILILLGRLSTGLDYLADALPVIGRPISVLLAIILGPLSFFGWVYLSIHTFIKIDSLRDSLVAGISSISLLEETKHRLSASEDELRASLRDNAASRTKNAELSKTLKDLEQALSASNEIADYRLNQLNKYRSEAQGLQLSSSRFAQELNTELNECREANEAKDKELKTASLKIETEVTAKLEYKSQLEKQGDELQKLSALLESARKQLLQATDLAEMRLKFLKRSDELNKSLKGQLRKEAEDKKKLIELLPKHDQIHNPQTLNTSLDIPDDGVVQESGSPEAGGSSISRPIKTNQISGLQRLIELGRSIIRDVPAQSSDSEPSKESSIDPKTMRKLSPSRQSIIEQRNELSIWSLLKDRSKRRTPFQPSEGESRYYRLLSMTGNEDLISAIAVETVKPDTDTWQKMNLELGEKQVLFDSLGRLGMSSSAIGQIKAVYTSSREGANSQLIRIQW